MPAGRLQSVAEYLGKPFEYFLPDGAIKSLADLPEEKRREIENDWKELEERRKEEEMEAEGMIRDLQILKDRPDLRALLYVGVHNTPEQVYRLTRLMESMNEGER